MDDQNKKPRTISNMQKRALILAVRAGELMMKNGAEVYRVEDTITRICRACHIPYVEVFATTTGVFVTIGSGGEGGDVYTYIKSLDGRTTDLKKISDLNKFSREFTDTDLSVESGIKRLSEIDNAKPYPLPIRLLGAGLVASFFCGIFSGHIIDSLCSFIIGVAGYSLASFLDRYDINYFIRGFTCCGLTTFLALLADSSGACSNYGAIVIGTIMIFVPGVAITNSIRDFLSGDMLAGVARMAEALIIAVSLATGAGIIIAAWNMIGGVAL